VTTILTCILLFSLNGNPPGTIRIKNHFVDKTEIQNIHWLEYIYHKGQELDSIEIHKLLPDSSNSWYAIPDNRFKPIVLITYEQALDYCAWRSEVVSKRIGIKVTYRLPTITEWKDIAEELIKTDLKQVEKELEATKKIIKKYSGQYILTDREKPKSKIYNMFDNVSEMTLEKGIAIGSNNHELTDLNTNLTRLIKYDSPNKYLGFRCVAEIE
jgi:formylglycine-generating enzyme required for sulfatase activity